MNLRKLTTLFIMARVRWVICLTCFTLGWLSMFVWMMVIRFAPEIAVDLIARVS